jgi:hypothetical protein
MRPVTLIGPTLCQRWQGLGQGQVGWRWILGLITPTGRSATSSSSSSGRRPWVPRLLADRFAGAPD